MSPGLPRQSGMIFDRRLAGNFRLGRNRAIAPNAGPFANMRESADCRLFADHRIAGKPAVDGRIGADLDPILNDHPPEARRRSRQLLPGSGPLSAGTHAELSNPRPWMDHHPVADQGMANRDLRFNRAIAPDADRETDHATCANERSGANLGPPADDGAGLNDDAMLEARFGVNHGAWVYARCGKRHAPFLLVRVKLLQSAQESGVWVWHDQSSRGIRQQGGLLSCDETCRRLCRLQEPSLPGAFEKCDFARPSLADCGCSIDDDLEPRASREFRPCAGRDLEQRPWDCGRRKERVRHKDSPAAPSPRKA